MTQRLTIEQAIIIQGFTGVVCAPWDEFRAELERRLGRAVLIEELHTLDVPALFREDFLRMLPETAEPVHALISTFKAAQDKADALRQRQANGRH